MKNMEIKYTFEQFCPERDRNILIDAVFDKDGNITYKCTEEDGKCETCKFFKRFNVSLK